MPSNHVIRVLVTGGGTANAICVLKGLRWQREVPAHVVLGDASDVVSGRFLADEFVRLPSGCDPDFAARMLEICEARAIGLVIPIIDYEFPAFAESAPAFLERGIRVVISRPEAVRTCGDKAAFAEFLARIGLPGARVYSSEDALSGRVPFPLFVKLRLGGRASLGTHVVHDVQELRSVLQNMEHPLIQELIEGDEYTIDALCDFEGRFIGAMSRVREEIKAGISVKGRTVDDPEIICMVKQLAEALPIIGPSNIQCFRKGDGSLVMSEVNLRFAGALTLSLAAGFNSPLLLLKLARGEKIDPSRLTLRYGVRMFRFWEEAFLYPDGSSAASPWGLYSR